MSDYLTLIQNILVSISIVIGGFWAYHKFRRRNERASLRVKIDKIEILKEFNNSFIYIEALIENIGAREVDLYFDYQTLYKDRTSKYEKTNTHYKAQISLHKVDENQELTLVSEKFGLTTARKKHHIGRLRSAVDIRLPYIIKVSEPGIYFVEFYIDINMKRYFNANDNNDEPIKTWSDRIYYKISKTDF